MQPISKNEDFPKMFYCVYEIALLTPALVTLALINATRKNNAELGPALRDDKVAHLGAANFYITTF